MSLPGGVANAAGLSHPSTLLLAAYGLIAGHLIRTLVSASRSVEGVINARGSP